MSHFTTVKTQIKQKEMLKKALNKLGYDNVIENGIIRGYQGNQQQADIVVQGIGGYDVGFVQEGEQYTIIADFWGLSPKERSLTEKIAQQYAFCLIQEESAKQGFQMAEQTVQKDGTIKIVMQKW